MYYKSQQQKIRVGLLLTLMLSVSLILSGCATTDVIDQATAIEDAKVDSSVSSEETHDSDPYENLNRKVFVFNDKLDKFVAKPVSDAYLWVTPQFVQTGIANFFNNLKDINVVLNDALQGKFKQSAGDTGRFAVNSTVGLLGLFDVATKLGLEKHDEDFAQTLAVWGVPEGPYLVLPVLGPTTSRGVPGGIFDAAANPTTYVGLPVQLVSMLNSRANAEGALNFIDEAALDPYVFTRESFLQYRKHLISDGESEITDDTLDLEEAFYEDDEDLSEEISEGEETIEQTGQNVQSKSEETETAENTYRLQLSADKKDFDQASDSFDQALESFQEATQSYKDASEKLDQLDHK